MNGPKQVCPSCGSESPADAQFCRDCGAILVRSGDVPRPSPTPLGSFEGEPSAPRPPEDKDKGKSTAALVIAAIIILGIALFFYERRDDGTQIPVPGQLPYEMPTEIPPTEAPPLAHDEPTLAPPPPVRDPDYERQPERLPEPPPRERDAAPPPEPELPSVESGRQFRPGWYRVKFRAPLFQSPSETAPIVTYLKPGTRIRVTHAVPGFLAVESTTGKAPGFVSTDDAEPERRGR